MTTEIKAIETKYKGYRFRSRLEARWAVFFDALEEPWEYEKEGFDTGQGYYLPDFWLSRLGIWVEIKGQWPVGDDRAKLLIFSIQTNALATLVGQIGEHRTIMAMPMLPKLGPVTDHLFNNNSPEFNKALERCPFCWDNKVTIKGTNTFEGNSLGCLALSIVGGCGHRWFVELRIDEQGAIRIVNVTVPDKHGIDFALLLAGSRDRYDAAIETARSARFEHGESGAQVRK